MVTLLGWLAIVAGAAWLAWAVATLGWRRFLDLSDAPPGPERPALVLGGPFALVRHPQSLGVLAMLLGTGLLWSGPRTWLATGLAAALVIAAARRDDARQAARFGAAYARYQQAVPFLVPRRR